MSLTLTDEQWSVIEYALSRMRSSASDAIAEDARALLGEVRRQRAAQSDGSRPYTVGSLVGAAVAGGPLEERRTLATYADPENWTHVHADGRHYWAWAGPVIVGYELAQLTMKRSKVGD